MDFIDLSITKQAIALESIFRIQRFCLKIKKPLQEMINERKFFSELEDRIMNGDLDERRCIVREAAEYKVKLMKRMMGNGNL